MSRFLPSAVRLLATALVLLAGFAVATPARAAKDIVQFGSTIEVGSQESVHDTVCFFCSINVKGTVNGDVVAFFGDVHVAGHANHDVVNFFGGVTADNNSSIGHDLVNFFGGVHLGQNVTVGQDTVVMFGNLRSEDSVSIGGSRVVEPAWIFWGPFLAIALGFAVVVHEIREHRRRRFLRGF